MTHDDNCCEDLLKQLVQIKQASWLFISVVEDLRLPRTNPASGQGGTRTRGLRIASPASYCLEILKLSKTLSPFLHFSSL